MKFFFFILKIFIITIITAYTQDIFIMHELNVPEMAQDILFERINNELLSYIMNDNEYVTELSLDNYCLIYELNNDNFEKVFLIIYRTGYIYHEYYVIFIVTKNDLTEIKNMVITTIDKRETMESLFPFNFER